MSPGRVPGDRSSRRPACYSWAGIDALQWRLAGDTPPEHEGWSYNAGMEFTALTPDEIKGELERLIGDVRTAFGSLNRLQLNWRTGAATWSVAQCLEHLVIVNDQMCRSIDQAADPAVRRSLWQRLPVLPGVVGRLLIRSQAPVVTRKYTAPAKSQPSASAIAADILDRFDEQQREVLRRVERVRARNPEQLIMASPLARVICYSVLDGLRLIVTHEHRHIQQARRVMTSPGFPE